MPAVPLISEFLYKLVCKQTQTVYKNPGYARRHDEKNLMVYVTVAVFLVRIENLQFVDKGVDLLRRLYLHYNANSSVNRLR